MVVDPFGVLPIFISLAKNRSPRERTGIATRAVLLGFMISLFFLVAGHSALAFLGVSVHAFSISNGILLFATAVPMLRQSRRDVPVSIQRLKNRPAESAERVRERQFSR